ncbi:MAG: RNA polymerase factor sigma-54 [Prevotella sp.]|nr:RNA polymerase factor sigma-54 [Prevotella sp.]
MASQEQIQEQRLTQQLRQTQTITQQQLLLAQLTELPIAQLVERVNAEMDDNPALEPSADDFDAAQETADYADSQEREDDYQAEQRQTAMDDALESLGRDDEDLPVYSQGSPVSDEREDQVYGETLSFYDQLKEQMGMAELTDHERYIMEYLIGSLDDDGLLRKSLDSIADELAVYHNVDTNAAELEGVLQKLQEFDPAGIGARSLQECLLLQIQRRTPSALTTLMEKVVTSHFELFTKKHWTRLQQQLGLNDIQTRVLLDELRRLNPKPGAALGEAVGRSMHQITPDYIVDTQDDGTVTFSLNTGDIPDLHVSQSFADTLRDYQADPQHTSRQMKEALLYTRKKVEAAEIFIDAMRTRRHTLMVTMRAIIQWQHRFFEDGDEASLRPMILKDIAEKTGLDVSTVSRVSKSKYAQTRWGTFPLRYFFSDGFRTADGDELSTREIKSVLRDIIAAEDKSNPLTDDALSKMMEQRGYPIARRTLSKYREQMGIPVARMRK